MTSLKSQFSDFFELPDEIVLNTPLLMLVGKKKLYLENHKGIALFRQDQIKIRINSGLLSLSGKDLEIEQIEPSNLFITGEIEVIRYEER